MSEYKRPNQLSPVGPFVTLIIFQIFLCGMILINGWRVNFESLKVLEEAPWWLLILFTANSFGLAYYWPRIKFRRFMVVFFVFTGIVSGLHL